mgnify:CR=1 FL=1
MQKGFYLDVQRCIGCHSCEVACRAYNSLPPRTLGTSGPRWRQVVTLQNGTFPNVTISNVSLSCMHCGKPACEAVCPTGAISKRADDGIVVVDPTKCIGCRYCFFACPFGVPQYGEDGMMQKCNFCLDRTEQGLLPACVAACPADALHAGTLEELSQLASGRAAERLASSTQPSFLMTP